MVQAEVREGLSELRLCSCKTLLLPFQQDTCEICKSSDPAATRRIIRRFWKPTVGKRVKWTVEHVGKEPEILEGVVVYSGANFKSLVHLEEALHWWLNADEMNGLKHALKERPSTVHQLASPDGVIAKVTRNGSRGQALVPHYYCPSLYFCDPVEPVNEHG